MGKTLYVINHCNQWHEYSSFRLIGVVDEEHLRQKMRKVQRELDYSEEDMNDYIDVSEVELNDLEGL